MTSDHRTQVDELLADYRRSREQLAVTHRELAAISASATSPDGCVTAVVDAQGVLTELLIADAAYRLRPPQLAEVVVRTTQAAVARAMEKMLHALTPVLPAATDPEALVRGTADLTEDELPPPNRRAPLVDDDEDFDQRDWLSTEAAPPLGAPTQSTPSQRRNR
ncbi:YbaB/EbfC family nucleoid-associated protein [Actinosynnema pretiosum subsp. pretiosum]|uniref:YbaB/EbfC DNA-binding family protein n=2 Tax=Actinosynnema TaxID=40566 RepID=C6WKD6_ACTMD|nr:YbaB/EbfC family nucleoid-associated protein [Actinosynnema mirum]ACU40187.1 hypothetical protein Amir_6386 [Actinosynnema mirum DSM 43827]AXX33700.1 hypothetical protein APASM_6335 [Actinosynnema pretiosum subsp. pretiosum]QUF02525.1 YbaB/EbfC family nucleoid-associated protein [Actinosynnema pretiosum subsp. pretiosum]